MKIICSRKDLYEGAGTVARAVSSRSALPILSHILISASDGRIELAATDLELGMRCSVDAKVDEEGAVTAPAKLLTDVLAALPDFDVTIETDDKNTLTLTCGASEFTILGLAADEYPVLPKMGDDVKFKIARKVLSEAVDRTVFATGRDESRPVLSGVYFKLENGTLKLVSTDTHRLCLETVPNVEYTGNTDAIVPAKALREMARLASLGSDEEGVAEITIADGRIMFEVDGITLTSRLIDGVFPNFMRVIPSNNPIKVIAPTDLLRRCAKRCALVAANALNRIVIDLAGETLTVSAESSSVGKAKEDMQVIHSGDDLRIAFNVEYLLDMVTRTETESIELEFGGEVKPALMKPQGEEDYIYVLMPMQLN